MCGRFTLTVSAGKVADFFGLADVPTMTPRYNISPTQSVLAIAAPVADAGQHQDEDKKLRKGRSNSKPAGAAGALPEAQVAPQPPQAHGAPRAAWFRWRLIPSWATDLSIGYRMINARADGVASKPAYRAAFKARRCLIVADGFFEWKATGAKKKQPYYFQLKDGQPFAFAGLWECWHREGHDEVLSCALITTTPNDVVGQVHDRMPVILPTTAYDQWLHTVAKDATDLASLLRPYPAEEMTATPVGLGVNNPRFDGPACVEPIKL
jgi:putative SOS response-associated peptidase YedK